MHPGAGDGIGDSWFEIGSALDPRGISRCAAHGSGVTGQIRGHRFERGGIEEPGKCSGIEGGLDGIGQRKLQGRIDARKGIPDLRAASSGLRVTEYVKVHPVRVKGNRTMASTHLQFFLIFSISSCYVTSVVRSTAKEGCIHDANIR